MKGFQNISGMKCFDFFAKSIRNIFFRQTKEIFCLEFFPVIIKIYFCLKNLCFLDKYETQCKKFLRLKKKI